MAPGISKRQQLRNEKTLQDLIRSVPGNDRCADCGAVNPGWASWNLGVFLCMRCASLHRKLGTHISKVKSLTMDSWSTEQVDNMKSHGNNIMNKLYNPKNVKPPIPMDIDEADSCMERFIRQKYQDRSLDGKPRPVSRHNTGRTRSPSPESSPPPLPAKAGKFFGFGLRTSKSSSHLRRPSPSSPPPPMPPRPSRRDSDSYVTSGASVQSGQSFESKMNYLRDMGFQNERRNATVLQSLNGNLSKSIETLQRVGEGPPRPRTQTGTSSQSGSNNPFDALDQKRPAQSATKSYNPFDAPSTQPAAAPSLEASFQNLQVSQPLFPHSTGGYPTRQMPISQTFVQQPLTPPVTAAFYQQQSVYATSQSANNNIYSNPYFQMASQPQTTMANNPYSSQTQSAAQPNHFFSQVSAPTGSSQPSLQSQPTGHVPGIPPSQQLRHANTMPAFLPTSSPLAQPSPFQQNQQAQEPAQNSYNPYQSINAPPSIQNGGYSGQFQFQPQSNFAPQPLLAQPTGRMDKNSILSLYNLSPPPPPIPEQPQQQVPPTVTSAPSMANSYVPTSQPQPVPQRSVSFPIVSGNSSRNPFMMPQQPGLGQQQAQTYTQPVAQSNYATGAPQSVNGNFMRSHMSQPSVDINGLQSGRHSPDAFASLSARYA